MQIFISTVAALLLSISEDKEQKKKPPNMTLTKNCMLFKLDNTPAPRFLATIHRFAEGEHLLSLRSFKGKVNTMEWKGKMVSGYEFWRQQSCHSHLPWDCGNPWKTPVKIANTVNNIQTEHFHSTAMAHYCHISPLGFKVEVSKFLYVWVCNFLGFCSGVKEHFHCMVFVFSTFLYVNGSTKHNMTTKCFLCNSNTKKKYTSSAA